MNNITNIVVENQKGEHGAQGSSIVEINYSNGSWRCVDVLFTVDDLEGVNTVLLDNGEDEITEDIQVVYH